MKGTLCARTQVQPMIYGVSEDSKPNLKKKMISKSKIFRFGKKIVTDFEISHKILSKSELISKSKFFRFGKKIVTDFEISHNFFSKSEKF